jgi:hypothetical protein
MVVSTGFLLPTAFLAEKPLSTHHLLTVTGALPRRANQTEKRGFEGITYYAPLEIVDMVGCFLVLSLAPFGEATEANLENGGTAPMKKSRNRCDLGR